jgi:hypothetical protein
VLNLDDVVSDITTKRECVDKAKRVIDHGVEKVSFLKL